MQKRLLCCWLESPWRRVDARVEGVDDARSLVGDDITWLNPRFRPCATGALSESELSAWGGREGEFSGGLQRFATDRVTIRRPSATRSDGGDDGTYSEPDIVWSEPGGVRGVSQACAK